MWNEQEVLPVSMPLSFSPIAHTSSAQETEVLFGDQLVSSRIRKARDTRDFGVSMNGVAIGSDVQLQVGLERSVTAVSNQQSSEGL